MLDRNPDNYFAETEQSAFEPGTWSPGSSASPDKMLQNRLISYADTHRYRIGANYARVPINCPMHAGERHPEPRRPQWRFDDNHGARENYAPNSFDDPAADDTWNESSYEVSGPIGRFENRVHRRGQRLRPGDQPLGGCSIRVSSERLVGNIAGHLGEVSHEDIRRRSLAYLASGEPGALRPGRRGDGPPSEVGSPTA